MRKLTLAMFGVLLAIAGMNAQTSCQDLNGYVDSKNTAGTGAYTLQIGQVEMASQTYHYSGPGKVTSVRVYGDYTGLFGGAPLRVGISNVDGSGRPTTMIQSQPVTFWYNTVGYATVTFAGGGVNVSSDFAVTVDLEQRSPWGPQFQLKYTGDGEGLGEDLASLAGTSTGGNWSSAMTNFSKDGDFYLIPNMTNFMNASFEASSSCVATNAAVSFANSSTMTQDMMFNTIALPAYSGGLYFYDWDFGDASAISHATNPSHTYATAGVYTVTLTCNIDGWNNNCNVTTTQVISVGLGLTSTSTSANCYGSSSGTATLTATGGGTPYSYSFDESPYQSSGIFNNLSAGTYTATVTDNQGCVSSTTVTINQPNAIVISNISSTNSSCGNSDGALLVTATGGTGTLQYQLNSSSFQPSGSFTGLASDFYTITVKDANACTTTANATVNDQGAPTLQILSQTNISCNGGNNGTLVMIGSGGSGTLQYSINGGVTWQTSGSFLNLPAGTYLVMVKDAVGCSYATEIVLSQPNAISFSVSSTPATCRNDNDGTITFSSVTGGIGAYSYSINNVNFQSSNVFTNLVAGTYNVYVHDIAGCSATATIVITQPTALTASVQITNASCNGSFSGSFVINASGGTAGYMYSLDGEYYQEDNTFSELEAGTYTIHVTDAHGCHYSFNATIAQPSVITSTITTGSSTCGNANGTVLVVAAGGSGSGYTYSINGINFFGSGAFSSLTSGNYDVIVRDGTGCENTFSFVIIDANGPTITSTSHTNLSCYESADGTITINSVTGGSGTLTYSVDGSTWQLSQNFTGLDAGTYTVLVKDANGCVGSVTVVLTQPTQIIVSNTITNVTCHGDFSGTITVSAAGGAGTLAYQIDGETAFQSSNLFTNLPAGIYLVIVRDAAGCFGYAYCTITEPSQIQISVGVLNVLCNGGSNGAIYVNAAGGTGTLSYSLDGVTYQSGNSFQGLIAGVYTVYVKDANGCVVTQSVTVDEPAVLSASSVVSDVVCSGGNDGVIDLTMIGGTSPYTFDWSNNATTEDVFNLAMGTYSVTVTDDHGCTYVQSFVITQPNNPLIVNGVVADASGATVADGGVNITTTGGTAPYTYLWSNGATTEDITGVLPGVYSVIITDVNGCSTTGIYVVSYTIGINTPTLSSASVSIFPNPAQEKFTVDAGVSTINKIEVMDILGQVIISTQPNTSKTEINVDGLSQGVYFVRVYSNGAMVTKRLEVSK